jgi:hypothetical protein
MSAASGREGGTGTKAAAIPKPIDAGPEMRALGRFYRDASDPGVINWRNEILLEDGSWLLIEEYQMIPV